MLKNCRLFLLSGITAGVVEGITKQTPNPVLYKDLIDIDPLFYRFTLGCIMLLFIIFIMDKYIPQRAFRYFYIAGIAHVSSYCLMNMGQLDYSWLNGIVLPYLYIIFVYGCYILNLKIVVK